MANTETPSLDEIHEVLDQLGVPYTDEQVSIILTKWGSQLTQFGLRQGSRRSDMITAIFLDQLDVPTEAEDESDLYD
ncbi:MAG: hypothetical protein ABIY70_10295 [Capsulimonas sp.]|uniref:hypothetical protein n=1 Tax=Capsulimonas sp. TaxID=2494211 RepID=UPI0032646055